MPMVSESPPWLGQGQHRCVQIWPSILTFISEQKMNLRWLGLFFPLPKVELLNQAPFSKAFCYESYFSYWLRDGVCDWLRAQVVILKFENKMSRKRHIYLTKKPKFLYYCLIPRWQSSVSNSSSLVPGNQHLHNMTFRLC